MGERKGNGKLLGSRNDYSRQLTMTLTFIKNKRKILLISSIFPLHNICKAVDLFVYIFSNLFIMSRAIVQSLRILTVGYCAY